MTADKNNFNGRSDDGLSLIERAHMKNKHTTKRQVLNYLTAV